MQVSANVEDYTFDQFRVDLHKFCNFIPIISTLTNLVAVIERRIYVPESDNEAVCLNSHYYTYLKGQDFKKDWLLFIPIANTLFSIARCCSTEVEESNAQQVIPLVKEVSKVELIEEKQEILTDYRPSFTPVTPDETGRYKPRYLLEIKNPGEKGAYLETSNIQWGHTPENSEPMKSPVHSIYSNMTPNKFFALCEKEYPHYELQHAAYQNGSNAFMLAAFRGNLPLLSALIDVVKEASPQFVNQDGGRNGVTPLIYACDCEDKKLAVEMAKILISAGADVNLSTIDSVDHIRSSSTPLSIAAKSENVELVQLLLQNGAKLANDNNICRPKWSQKRIENFELEEKIYGPYTPFSDPDSFRVNAEEVDFIVKLANIFADKQALEKCLPLIMAQNALSLSLNLDIITEIVKTTRATMEIKFW